ncbi:hypothetical protein ABC255_16970 [Neobacillus sp. 3P2-tot-E-2]|uniref:hypothetical protein n=1 Tax=Neobacillus sp. 3P2-tot-E-2 TaxID=3132212 RepID=UPI0039A11F0E
MNRKLTTVFKHSKNDARHLPISRVILGEWGQSLIALEYQLTWGLTLYFLYARRICSIATVNGEEFKSFLSRILI